jgi:hypothetical protein
LGFEAISQKSPVDLKPEDQPYYKNQRFDGMNKLQRIDSLVIEVNKIYGEMATMKAEMTRLKEEVEKLKAEKK